MNQNSGRFFFFCHRSLLINSRSDKNNPLWIKFHYILYFNPIDSTLSQSSYSFSFICNGSTENMICFEIYLRLYFLHAVIIFRILLTWVDKWRIYPVISNIKQKPLYPHFDSQVSINTENNYNIFPHKKSYNNAIPKH